MNSLRLFRFVDFANSCRFPRLISSRNFKVKKENTPNLQENEEDEGNSDVQYTTVWEKVRNRGNDLQKITDKLVYKVVAGFFFFAVLSILLLRAWLQYRKVRSGLYHMWVVEDALNEIHSGQLGKYFLNDQRIWSCVNISLVHTYYNNVLMILWRMDMLGIKWNALDLLANQICDISIILALLPFFLNLSWFSNLFTIAGAFLTKFMTSYEKPVAIMEISLVINVILASCLLGTHFVTISCMKIMEKEKDFVTKNKEKMG